MNNVISANRVNVTVMGQVFSIPSEKVSELYRLLANWQSISVTEGNPQPGQYQGNKLLLG